MDKMPFDELHDAMFWRKSVRKYHMERLQPDVLQEIKDALTHLTHLDESIKVRYVIKEHGQMWSLFRSLIPYYVTIWSEPKDNYRNNVGFLGQQISLYLASKGLGSCWQGAAKPDEPSRATDGTEYVITLGFGQPAEPLARRRREFKRKALGAISAVDNAEDLLEPVRLAPSALNRQPWYFYGTPTEIHVAKTRLRGLGRKLYGSINDIDMGIALCHLFLSARDLGKTTNFVRRPEHAADPPPGYEYVITAHIRESSFSSSSLPTRG